MTGRDPFEAQRKLLRDFGEQAKRLNDAFKSLPPARANPTAFPQPRRVRDLDPDDEPPGYWHPSQTSVPVERTYDVSALSMLKVPGQAAKRYGRTELVEPVALLDDGGSQNRAREKGRLGSKQEARRLEVLVGQRRLYADPGEPGGLYVAPDVAFDDDGGVWLRIWAADTSEWLKPSSGESGPGGVST